MRKYYILSGIALILVVLVVIKIINNHKKDSKQPTNTAAAVVPAECYLARDTIISNNFRAVGYLRANERVDVVTELSGRIVKIGFKEGYLVKKGELLFQIDDSEWQAALKKIMAELELSRITEERNLTLYQSGGTSKQVYEESVSKRKVLEAESEALQVKIEKSKIRAAFSGKTGIREVSEGAFVNPGMILTTLEDISSLKIELTVPEIQANTIHTGDQILFNIEGSPKDYQAVINAIDPAVSTTTGNLRFQAVVKGTPSELIPGTAITVNMDTKSAIPGLYVPTQSLIANASGYNLYLVNAGKAKLVPVSTGLRSVAMVEIKGGIKEGDSILTTGFMKVKPDVKLKILKVW